MKVLSLWRWFAANEKSVGVQEVSREHGVRYVLGGTVRKADNRIRHATQLIDADTNIRTSNVIDLGLDPKEASMAARRRAQAT